MPTRRRPEECSECHKPVQLNERHCPACGADAGYPHVKLAVAQRTELRRRANAARAAAITAGRKTVLDRLEAALDRSKATIAMSPMVAHGLLSRDNTLYAAYHGQVRGKTRRIALPDDDRRRTAVEATLFGTAGTGEITYAALSVDGRGLGAYGALAGQLRSEMIAARATALEQNSFAFVQTHHVVVGEPPPKGYVGAWADRKEVAVAKLGARLPAAATDEDLADLVLHTKGSRATDDFVEVHIWGPLNHATLESWRVLTPITDPAEQTFLALVEHLAQREGHLWTPLP